MYMQIYLKITDEQSNIVTEVRSKKKRRILYVFQADRTPNAQYYLRVTYIGGFHNDGDYRSKEDLLMALGAFTERQ